MENATEEVCRQLMEYAKGISRLADQVTDRQVKICLIGLAFQILDAMEIEARKSERRQRRLID